MKCTLHCLNNLIIKGICSEHFPDETVPVVLDVAYRILKKPLTLMNQLLLSHSFILISTLSKSRPPRSESYHLISSIGLEIVRRLHQPGELDSKLDGSLKITAVNYIWHTIVKHQRIRKIFVDRGGIYLLLDLAKTSSLPVQVVLMGLIADLSNDSSTIPQIVTWRGDTEKETVLALLSSIWRKQEVMKEVKRDRNGCINESDVILEGRIQASLLPSWKYCAASTEMQGCARPKIYAIYYNILRRHSETSESAREAYGVDIHNIGFRDEITLKIIDNFEFFKKGEVWRNLWSGLLNIKTTLLPQIETALFILSKTYLYTAGNVATVQQGINAREIKKDLDKEKALYDELRSCMLTEALDSFMIIRNELYSTNREQATTAKVLLEKELADQRQRLDIDVMVPEYHATRVIGVNLSKGQPSLALRIRKNSTLIRPDEHLNKKQTKDDDITNFSLKSIPKQ
uniref:Cilia- and flagella-associated protein 69 ARM repeats domain-containing protein n=1 Tax=Lygus hesperus TaxID=30085 RepID=A0A0A9VPT3_LYGHE